MATFSGTIGPIGTPPFRVTLWPEGYRERVLEHWVGGRGADLTRPPIWGAYTDNSPPPRPVEHFSGEILPSWLNDFYFRIYLIPSEIDFGAVTNDVTQSFTIWNAYPTSTQLLDIFATGAEGLTLNGSLPPSVFLPYASATYQITASADGPATFSAGYTFVFDTEAVTLPVTGNRALLWPFKPNWAHPYRIIYNYKTEILETESGREQRRAYRQSPRRRLEHTATLMGAAQLRRYKHIMSRSHDRVFVFPERTRFVETASGMPPNLTVMQFPEVPNWVLPGMTVVLEHGDSLEMRTVEAVNPTSVEFAAATETTWPAGTRMFAAMSGYLAPTLEAPRHTNAVADVTVAFNAQPGADLLPDVPPPSVFLAGRPVFLDRWNWARDVSITNEHRVSVVDFDFGRTQQFSPLDFATIIQQSTYLQRSPEQADRLLDFFRFLRGQWGEFFQPTWEHDMDMLTEAVIGAESVTMAGREVFDTYHDDTVHRAILIRLHDGTLVLRAVSELALTGATGDENTIVTVTEPWDISFGPANVDLICWMPLRRLASDGLTMEWITSNVAECQLSTRTLELLPEEVPE